MRLSTRTINEKSSEHSTGSEQALGNRNDKGSSITWLASFKANLGALKTVLATSGYRHVLAVNSNCVHLIQLLCANLTKAPSGLERFVPELGILFLLLSFVNHLVGRTASTG